MRKHALLLIATTILTAGFTVGCSDGPKLGRVQGTITLDGAPVPFAYVEFQPVDPPGTYGAAYSDENGQYDLLFTRSKKGALVGKHEVRVRTSSVDEIQIEDKATGRMITPPLPPGYQPRLEVTFDREVEPGSNVIDLEIPASATVQARQRNVR
uniref:Carboxypeptidase regulatory-like domain-containing protein n=1 Tax=Schlesneria paludicola TaxID=360056 RepID=A0A7C2K1E2_9PLAN